MTAILGKHSSIGRRVICRRECCLERQAGPVEVHDEGQEADTNRPTSRGLHYLLDVDGAEDSEERRLGKHNGVAVPRVRNAFSRSSALPFGWSLCTELAGME